MSVILDGTGKGYTAQVSEDNQLKTRSVSQSIEHYTNFEKGRAWQCVLSQTPTGANDTFFYIKNTGSVPLVMEGYYVRVASAESVKVFIGTTGTPASGTDITAVNMKTSSSLLPTATIQSGNDITGLTNGSSAGEFFHTSTATDFFNFEMDLIIDVNGIVSFEAQTGAVQIDMVIPIYETSV